MIIYLLDPGSKANLEGGRVAIQKKDGEKQEVPLKDVDGVVLSRNCQITTQTVFSLLQRKASVFYVNGYGKICGALSDETLSQHSLEAQMMCFNNLDKALTLAKYIVEKKIRSEYQILRQYAKRIKSKELLDSMKNISGYFHEVNKATSLDTLRGLEGIAARNYFNAFSSLLNQEKWEWKGRKKHPAPDPVNAVLSYGYYFLEKEVRIALAGIGLDARFGFIHSNNGRKDSLVYDVMDLFRQEISDRFVLTVLRKNLLKPEYFSVNDGNCMLNETGRRVWIQLYEEYMNKKATRLRVNSPREWIRKEIYKFYKIYQLITKEYDYEQKAG